MSWRDARQVFAAFAAAVAIFVPATRLHAQVTTATLYGLVRDTTSAVLPGVNVTAIHQGTNLVRETVSDARGEFVLQALPTGKYTLKIELSGFKTYSNQGLDLGGGQAVRQTYVLEVGDLSETITVAETAPLVETASAAQVESLGAREVRELPVPRRNLQAMVGLSSGVSVGDTAGGTGRSFRVNGAGDGGTGITVDGSSANANPETRGFSQYGGQNQIEILSLEAVAEVQIVKGILPAEYGGAVGGHVNMLTRSGSNVYHGSAFNNHQNESFFARDPFLPPTTAKPTVTFNQFGGSLGGPIIRNRALFFAAYEGYRDEGGVTVQGNVPTQQTRDRVLAALPFPETKLALDTLPLPNQAINADIGRYITAKQRTRQDNHFLIKGDLHALNGILSVTVSRLRPFTVNPSFENGNSQSFDNASDRVATQYVLARGGWVSESRFGWNHNTLVRPQDFWFTPSPTRTEQTDLTDVRRRLGNFSVAGLFTTAQSEVLDMKNHSFNVDQKISRVIGPHNAKVGFRWYREQGSKTNTQANQYVYQTLADLISNTPNSILLSVGQPPHQAHLDEWGLFIQDDWRLNDKLMLNLGLRYDYYPSVQFRATSDIPAEIVNLDPPSDLRLQDFGAARAQDDVFNPDRMNFGPRIGFAWKLDEKGETVVRGGFGVLYSGHLFALFQNTISDPLVPGRVAWNRTEVAQRGLKWPYYAEDLRDVVIRDAAGKKALYGIIDANIRAPHTYQSMIDVQKAFGSTWMFGGSYVHTAGRDFPMSRNFALSFDRQTGLRPNPALGNPSGWYIDSSQTMDYNAFEANVRRHSTNFELSLHYTLSKGWAQQGGDLVGNFDSVPGSYFATQDFYDPDFDRTPLSGEVRHRVTASAIYEIPWLKDGTSVPARILGGWQISSVLNVRTGLPLRITQPSGIGNSRPDYNGGEQVFSDWRDTLLYLDRSAYTLVPTYSTTNATVRPGTQNPSQVQGPPRRTVDVALAKTLRVNGGLGIQFRAEAFNAFNWVNYNNPTINVLAPDFGRLTSAAGPRTGQVGVRVTF